MQGETETTHINGIIQRGAAQNLTDRGFLAAEIRDWLVSPKRQMQIHGEKYYNGEQAILRKKRQVIGKDGKLEVVKNLPNSRIVDNQYARLVDQKANYLVGNPPTFDGPKETVAALQDVLGKGFFRTLRTVAEDALNGGVGWLMPWYGEDGKLQIRRFEPYEILPFWADADHTVLDSAVHLYEVETYENATKRIVQHVEVLAQNGVYFYIYENGALTPEDPTYTPYATINGTPQNWLRIPLIAWKANAKEIPLLRRVRALQDAINLMESAFEDGMRENPRNTILIVVNYDGTDLGELRQNLATYSAVKVRDDATGKGGDVRTLQVEVNAENYQVVLKLFKQALIENGRGYDAKDDRLSGNPNQMNIQSMYSDIDLDANAMESEFQASFEQLFWFLSAHLQNSGIANFDLSQVSVTFNRNVLINNSELIQQCKDSVGLVSDRTILAHHPFVDSVDDELAALKKEKQEDQEVYGNTLPTPARQEPANQVTSDE